MLMLQGFCSIKNDHAMRGKNIIFIEKCLFFILFLSIFKEKSYIYYYGATPH